MSQRLEYIDHLKAVAITLVVFGHFLIAINPIRFSYHPVQIVYSFHMPLFFFLSGFMVGFKDNGKLPFSFIKKKMATLLLPWLSWTMISACYLGGGGNNCFHMDILQFYPFNGYWFLPVLFILMVLYFVYNKIYDRCAQKKNIHWLIGLGIMGLILLMGLLLHEYNLLMYAVYWFIFLFGSFVAKYELISCFIKRKDVFFVATIVLLLLWKIYPLSAQGVAWKSLANIAMFLVISVVSSISLFNIVGCLYMPAMVKRTLGYIGQKSLIIYLIPVVPFAADYKLQNEDPVGYVCLVALGLAAISIMVSIVIGNILMCVPYLRYLLFGKK